MIYRKYISNTTSYEANSQNSSKGMIFFEEKILCGKSLEIIKLVQEKNQKILDQNKRIKELKNSKSELEEKAYYDKLTGLLNRHGLEKEIKEKFKNGDHISLIVFDIENLKIINDYYGNISGDKAIKQTAEILKKYFRFNNSYRPSDIICRHGGDEFLIILKKLDEGILKTRIRHILAEIENINKVTDYHFGAHIGLIDDHTINDYQIANEKGLIKAKGKLKKIKNR